MSTMFLYSLTRLKSYVHQYTVGSMKEHEYNVRMLAPWFEHAMKRYQRVVAYRVLPCANQPIPEKFDVTRTRKSRKK